MLQPPPPPGETTAAEDNQTPTQQTYRLHSINSSIVIRQLPSQGLSFQLWPAAATLLSLLDRHGHGQAPIALSSLFASLSHPIRILELGSGTGLAGIAAAALLPARVTVTDLPNVLPNLRFNADANAEMLQLRGGEVDVAALSWGDRQQMEAIGRDYDLILGSDIVYHDHLYEPLLETLMFLLLGGEKRVYFLMTHLKRWKKESAFFKKAKKAFDVEVVHRENPSDGSRVGVSVYQFVRRQNGIP